MSLGKLMNPTFLVVIFAIICSFAMAKQHPQAALYFTDYCRFFKYPVQTYNVTTQDGYILTIFRIQKKNSNIRQGLKPIFLQHGLLDSSDTWIINDQNKAPGFMLANRGFDVWFGNSRGNKHSRHHTTLNPDKGDAFWQFTFQDMADYDVPAVLAYINNITNQKIHYLGHSQGTIMMHIALSKRNSKVQKYLDKYFGFGPVAYVKHMTSPFFDLVNRKGVVEWFKIRRQNQLFPSLGWFESDVGRLFCSTFDKVCGDIMKFIMDANPGLDNYERYDVLVGHDPSGTSLMNVLHWKQMVDTGIFGAYDYGSAKENDAHYGQPYPPIWNITNIQVPIHLFAGSSDELADLTDVNYMWSLLKPQSQKFLKVYNAGHCTFMWGNDVNPWMNDLYSFILVDADENEKMKSTFFKRLLKIFKR